MFLEAILVLIEILLHSGLGLCRKQLIHTSGPGDMGG